MKHTYTSNTNKQWKIGWNWWERERQVINYGKASRQFGENARYGIAPNENYVVCWQHNNNNNNNTFTPHRSLKLLRNYTHNKKKNNKTKWTNHFGHFCLQRRRLFWTGLRANRSAIVFIMHIKFRISGVFSYRFLSSFFLLIRSVPYLLALNISVFIWFALQYLLRCVCTN